MLPPIGERRADAPGDEPGGEVTPSPPLPPEPNVEATPAARQRLPNTRDLVALYAARADANAIDLRPLIDERRERRPTEAAPVVVRLLSIKPRPVGRGTAEHRDAVRRARATTGTAKAPGTGGDRMASPKVWRRWLPTVGVSKLATLVGTTVRGFAGPRKRSRPRARRVVQGRA